MAPSHGPNGGAADSRDEAKAAFRAAWERPLSEKADSICLDLSISDRMPLTLERRLTLDVSARVARMVGRASNKEGES